jgi:hypothetical protein
MSHGFHCLFSKVPLLFCEEQTQIQGFPPPPDFHRYYLTKRGNFTKRGTQHIPVLKRGSCTLEVSQYAVLLLYYKDLLYSFLLLSPLPQPL